MQQLSEIEVSKTFGGSNDQEWECWCSVVTSPLSDPCTEYTFEGMVFHKDKKNECSVICNEKGSKCMHTNTPRKDNRPKIPNGRLALLHGRPGVYVELLFRQD